MEMIAMRPLQNQEQLMLLFPLSNSSQFKPAASFHSTAIDSEIATRITQAIHAPQPSSRLASVVIASPHVDPGNATAILSDCCTGKISGKSHTPSK
jgi:hypothetical protein